MNDDTKKTNVLFVKKKDAQKGNLWNTLTNGRIIKQHGGFDIPEGDLHAIPKYQSPIEGKETSPEETKEALSELEQEIKQLKEQTTRNKISSHSSPPAPNNQNRDDDL